MNIPVVSFPRSGSNFFMTEFSAMSGISLKLTHAMLNCDTAISCIRNPKDTLVSLLAMKVTQMNYELESVSDSKIVSDCLKVLDQMKVGYKKFYQYLLDSTNIMVDYESFCKYPSLYVKKICDSLNINLLPDRVSMYKPKDNPKRGYLVSSLSSSGYYDVASKIVMGLDLKELEDLYKDALSKSLCL
jgi:hypothetical protein